jgi:uncharacterized membrane protein
MLTSSSRISFLSFTAASIICGVPPQLTAVDAFSSSAVGNNGVSFLSKTKVTPSQRNNVAAPKATRLFAGSAGNVVPGIGEEGCNLPSVSGWNTKSDGEQALLVKGIYFALAAGTYLFSSGLSGFSEFMGSNFESQYEFFRSTWPLTFGAVFSLAGITHFTLADEYENIVPTQGAWGLWNVPGSRAFHVAWTGVAELAGGLGLLAGGLSPMFGSAPLAPLTSAGLESDSAAALFLLTLVVTPANIFMYTHGAKLPMDSEPVPVTFHAVRLVMQIVLLGFLYQMGVETFQVLFDRTYSP